MRSASRCKKFKDACQTNYCLIEFRNKTQALILYILYKSKKEGKDQESIQSSATPVPGYQWESDNFTITDISNESQEVSPFPAGDHKTLINRRTQKHNKNKTEIT